MDSRRWAQTDRFMRAGHLYTSLFLVPWMMVYAISAFLLNHSGWFAESKQAWVDIRSSGFVPGESFPKSSGEQARAILQQLDLDGAHRISQDDERQLVIYRPCARGYYQVVWQRQEARLVVRQQQPVSFYSFVNALHFQHGYDRPYADYLPWAAWAFIVDVVTVSTVFWVISGVYLWARRPRKRILGGVCLAAGFLLFAVLAVYMSR